MSTKNKLLSAAAMTLVLSMAPAAFAHEWESTPPAIDHATGNLSPQKAAQFRDTMKDAHEENKDIEAQIHQVRGDLYRIMTAPSFNQEAFLDKSNQLRKLHDQAEANINESFTTALAALSQSDRKAIAQGMHEGHVAHGPHHHMHGMVDNGNPGAERPGSEYPSPANAPVRP